MPFIVGLQSSQLALVKKMHLESVVFVDLDGNFINANIEDAAILPRERVTILKDTIEEALHMGNSADPIFSLISLRNKMLKFGEGSEQVRFKKVQHAFREFFLSVMMSYRRCSPLTLFWQVTQSQSSSVHTPDISCLPMTHAS